MLVADVGCCESSQAGPSHNGFLGIVCDVVIPDQTVVDGELVAFDAEGQPSFNELQNADSKINVVFYIFDVLMVGGKDVEASALRDRVSMLESVLVISDRIQRSEQFACGVQQILSAVRSIGGEGVIAKRLDSRYEQGKRSGSWQKMRINLGQEFVIGGFTPGSDGFDAVIVGFYDGGSLQYPWSFFGVNCDNWRIHNPSTQRILYDRKSRLLLDLVRLFGALDRNDRPNPPRNHHSDAGAVTVASLFRQPVASWGTGESLAC